MELQVDGADVPGSEYHVRRFRADDRDAFLALYGAVADRGLGRQRFAWKFEDNPYVYHVPIFVAETDGDLVGALPFLALELSVDGRRRIALQPCDAVVHPDHRERGLFGRMIEAAVEAYHDCDVSFFFAFPAAADGVGYRAASADDYLELGFRRVADHPTYYRVQDAAALERAWSGWWAASARALQPALDGYNGLSNHRLRPPDAVTVERYDSIPAAMLAGIEYDRRRRGVSVHRDVRFYDWRFDDPAREYTAYVAERAGEPIAGLVVGSPDGGATVRLTDVTPLPRRDGLGGLEAILGRVVREHADADLLAAPPVLPEGLAGKAGFRRDDRTPLRSVGTTRTHVVRVLDDGTEVDGVDVTDPDNWQPSFAERGWP